jgi:hypothetical protein
MRKILLALTLLAISSPTHAAIYAYYGIYPDSNLPAYAGATKDFAKYRAGLHLEKKYCEIPEIGVSPFMENEVLMDSSTGTSWSPASSNFIIGLKFNLYSIDVIVQHACWHIFENRQGYMSQYNLIEFRWYLQR